LRFFKSDIRKYTGQACIFVAFGKKKYNSEIFFVRKQDFCHLIKTERQRGGDRKICGFFKSDVKNRFLASFNAEKP